MVQPMKNRMGGIEIKLNPASKFNLSFGLGKKQQMVLI
jgi:hypothetical protein